MNGVVLSRSKNCLLGQIRLLRHSNAGCIGIKCQIRGLTWDSGEHFSALCNLHSLTLSAFRIERIGEDMFHTRFSAFREALTCLSLDNFTTSFSAFVTLVDYFPNIATLRLDSFLVEPDEEPVPSLSRPLRGKLYVYEVLPDRLEFFNRFAELDLEYEELTIDSGCIPMGATFVESALQLSRRTVKSLRLACECEYPLPALPIKTATLPNPLILKPELHRQFATFDNSGS